MAARLASPGAPALSVEWLLLRAGVQTRIFRVGALSAVIGAAGAAALVALLGAIVLRSVQGLAAYGLHVAVSGVLAWSALAAAAASLVAAMLRPAEGA